MIRSWFFFLPFSSFLLFLLSLSPPTLSLSVCLFAHLFLFHTGLFEFSELLVSICILFSLKKDFFLTIMSSNIFPPFSPSSYSWTFTSDRSVHSYILLKLCSLIFKIISERFIWISSGFFSPVWIILGIWIILSLMLNFFSPKLFIYRQLFFFRCLI